MLNLLRNSINAIRSVSGLDSDASAFITAAGLTDPTQKSAINILVKDMKASGLWTKMKAVYPMVGGTATSMKFNLKDPRDLDAAFRLTWSGGWTYSATGATPNGTNAYADTKFNLLNNVPGYNNAFGVYYRTNNYGVFKVGALGTSFDQGMSAHLGWINSSGTLYNDNLGRNSMLNSAYGTFDAFHISTVTSTASQKLYRNGVLKLSGAATNGITLPSINFYYGAANVNGTATYFDNQQWAFGILSTGLTDQDAQLLNQIVEKYQVALSRGVQAAQSFYYNSAYSNEANTYLYSTQITGTTQVSAINTLINGLKANNLWTKMKAVYPFVTDYRNLVAYTQSFTNAYWDKSITTVIDANTTDPNGTTTASKLTEAAGTGSHHIHNSIGSFTPVVGQAYAMSCYVKQTPTATNRYVQLPFFIAGFGSNAYVNFDVQTGVVGTIGSSITSYSITLGNDGWYRITATATATATGSSGFQLSFIPSATSTRTESYTVTAGNEKSIYIWGVQIEMGSTASVYQPVLGANNYSTNVAAQMKFNLVNPQDSDAAFRLAFSGGWTYSTNGAQPNGTNGYADTKFNLSSNFSTREQSYSLYTQASNSNANVLAGVTDGSSPTQFYNGTGQFNILSTLYAKGSSFSNGCILMTSTLSAISAFEKAIKIGTTSGSTYSAVNYNYYIGARNNAGASDFFADRRYSFAHIGNSLTDTEATLLSQLIQQYQTDLSRQV